MNELNAAEPSMIVPGGNGAKRCGRSLEYDEAIDFEGGDPRMKAKATVVPSLQGDTEEEILASEARSGVS